MIKSMLFDQPLVYDLSHHSNLTRMEQKLTASQLMFAYSVLRDHPQPLPATFCNADPQSYLVEQLERLIPKLYEPDFPIVVTPKSYLGPLQFISAYETSGYASLTRYFFFFRSGQLQICTPRKNLST